MVYENKAGFQVSGQEKAQVVKLGNTLASGASASNGLGVRISPWAHSL